MSSEFNEKNYSTKMDKSILSLKKDISTLRTGRANVNMLDTIKVDVYGQLMPINQIATISVPEARLISIQIWFKSEFSFKNLDNFPLDIFSTISFGFPELAISALIISNSLSIIINASNEVLVNYFLNKKIPFKAIFEIISDILNDRNYKKNAIKRPNNLDQINKINAWAKQRTLEKISSYYD